MAKRVLLLDTGREWGGGTSCMIELLKRIDRDRFAVTPLFYDDYARGGDGRLSDALAEIGYTLRLLPRRRQPRRATRRAQTAPGPALIDARIDPSGYRRMLDIVLGAMERVLGFQHSMLLLAEPAGVD